MKKENFFFVILGFFIAAYVLDAVVNPLKLNLATPYQYFNNKTLLTYPFTSVSILLKSLAIFMLPLLLMSYLGISTFVKGIITLILSGLLQLYAVQDIASGNFVVPLEWSLSFATAGVALVIPTFFFLVIGLLKNVHRSLSDDLPDDTPPTKPSSSERTLHKLHPQEL